MISVVSVFVLLSAVPGQAEEKKIQDMKALDPNMATRQPGDDTLWYDIRELGVEGKGWTDTQEFYDRLPARAEGVVRDPVWQLSLHSAGMCVRFVTDASSISARWTLRFGSLAMPHMPATGVSGLDLYAREKGQWHWAGAGRPEHFPDVQQSLVSGLAPGEREYLLYLPLYNGVQSVQVGVPAGAKLFKAPAYPEEKPICFYGTSITQGGCASRPGMAYPAILGRWLDRPVINLGFSGNGQMELEVANLLTELDPCAYVIDCLPNLDATGVRERTEPLVETLRKARPGTPIVLVESIVYQNSIWVPDRLKHTDGENAELQSALRRLKDRGVKGLYLVKGNSLLGEDGEATVDGAHPTDAGFLRIAEAMEPTLRHLIRHQR